MEGLIVSLFAVNHSEISFRSFFISKCNLDGFGAENNKQVSSAKSLGVQLTDEGKSLMYNINSKGLRIEPWEPVVIA